MSKLPGTPSSSTTPGPWLAKLDQFDFTNAGERMVVYGDPHTETYGSVAFVRPILERKTAGKNKTPYNAPDAERDANARLLAAAPDLLHALERVRDDIHEEGELMGTTLSLISRAIEKARGQ